jgi:tRNA threonylcarbamoyl adenosine modification protein YeaZ
VLVLALDSATERTSVALHDGHTVVAFAEHVDGRRHAEVLAPMIQQVLADADVTARDLHRIACGVGPGPYTGLRVGLATAVAMGAALDIPVVGVCSLDVIAAQSRRAGVEQPLLVATDARRREIYAAAYVDDMRLLGPVVLSAQDAVVAAREALGSDASRLVAVGSGALLYREVLADSGVAIVEGASESAYPDAGMLAAMVAAESESEIAAAAGSVNAPVLDHARGSGIDARVPLGLLPPRPLYLRRPDATEPTR